MSLDIGIDFSTARMKVYGRDEGIVLDEPLVVAFDKDTKVVRSVGKEAAALEGRTSGNIITSYLFENNLMLSRKIVGEVINYIVKKAIGKIKLIHPRMCIAVPVCCTKEVKQIIKDCAYEAGAREVYIFDGPVAIAIGAKINIKNTPGNIIVNIGERSTDIEVVSFGKIINKLELKTSEKTVDEKLSAHMIDKYGLLVGNTGIHEVKNEFGDLSSYAEEVDIIIKGRRLSDGLLGEAVINSREIKDIFMEVIDDISSEIKKTAGKINDKVKDDILARGIILTGKGVKFPGFERVMEEKTGIQTMIPDNPDNLAVTGTGIVLEYTGGKEV